ncbi:MAG: hypothetical protein U1E93_03975 [Alphaproteobacteria bacterium]
MTKKIPVGRTIAHAYRFVFTQPLAIFKAAWLPMLASLAVAFLFFKRMILFMTAAQAHDPAAVSLFGSIVLLIALLLVFFFAQFTAITETAMGRPAPSWIALHFSWTMWRMLGSFLAGAGVIAVVTILVIIVAYLAGLGLDALVKAVPGLRLASAIAAGLAVLACLCVIVFTATRFLFLLGPVTVSRQGLGLARSWELSNRNFWRMFLVTLSILIPVGIANRALSYALVGLPPTLPANLSKAARDAAEMAWQITQMNKMTELWYIFLPIAGLLMLFQLGAGCAAQAFAYQKLTEDDGLA